MRQDATHSGKLPTFLVIGASKTGTTSLHGYLAQHPDIFMSPTKEPGFFAFEGNSGYVPTVRTEKFVTTLEEYERLFTDARPNQHRGESSVQYLHLASQDIADRIRKYLPDVRLITILRHPVDHAHSTYTMQRRSGRIGDVPFEQIVEEEFQRFYDFDYAKYGYRFVARSYAHRLKAFLDNFANEQVLVCLYDEFANDPVEFVKSIFRFIGVDDGFTPDMSVVRNKATFHGSAAVAFLLNRPNPIRYLARHALPHSARISGRELMQSLSLRPAPRLDPKLRAQLSRRLEGEIAALETLLDRDLSHWRAR